MIYEPYWPYVARLFEWAAASVPTTLLSCLASHASILLFDGIDRVPRAVKCTGVFRGEVENPYDPLAFGLPEKVPFPHSRINDVPEDALAEAGYRIVVGSGSSGAGWAVAARQQGDGLFVLCQGHPEYGTLSLLREYRRDVRRYLFGRGAVPYPRPARGLPVPGCGGSRSGGLRAADAARARDADPRELWSCFPFDEVAASVENTWAAPSAILYANWLSLASAASTVWFGSLCTTRLSLSTAATRQTPPGPWRSRSTRRSRTTSSTPTTPARSWIWRLPGYHYNRLNNPTVDVLEQRITALEGGAAAMAVSSGAAAVSMSVLNLVAAGDNFVSVPQLYGATYTYFAHVLPTLGVETRFAADDRPESIGALIDGRTKAVYCETVGNPAGNVIDLAAVADVAHAQGVPVIADNTVATPLLLKPIKHGADVVIHSLTKFIGGHGTSMGGIVIDGGTFPWAEHSDRFPDMLQPEPAFHGVSYATDFQWRSVRDPVQDDRAAQYGRGPVAVQRVPAPPGPRDPVRAAAAPRGQCSRGGGVSGGGSARRLGQLPRHAREPLLTNLGQRATSGATCPRS